MLVLKKFIYETKLFSPYSGGLSSYGLFLMAVALIQNEEFASQSSEKTPYSNENNL
jgi:DNA polymerase sigma